MVSPEFEVRGSPEYSLDRIRQLAESGAVAYASTRVELDIQNLGYSPDEVNACIASLEPEDFRQCVKYANRRFWMDEYRLRWRSVSGSLDPLYLKLHLNRDVTFVFIDSIHRDR